jgi:hypothetical protein
LSRQQDPEHKSGRIPRKQQLKLDKGAGIRFIQHTSPRTPATTLWNPGQTLPHFLRIPPFTPCNPEQDQLSFEYEFNDHLEQDADSTIDSFFASNGSGGQVKENDALEGLFEKYRGKNPTVDSRLKNAYIDFTPDPKTDEDKTISVEGTMKYLKDLGLNLESAEILVPLQIVKAPALGEMTKDEFVEGWKAIG